MACGDNCKVGDSWDYVCKPSWMAPSIKRLYSKRDLGVLKRRDWKQFSSSFSLCPTLDDLLGIADAMVRAFGYHEQYYWWPYQVFLLKSNPDWSARSDQRSLTYSRRPFSFETHWLPPPGASWGLLCKSLRAESRRGSPREIPRRGLGRLSVSPHYLSPFKRTQTPDRFINNPH